MLLNFLKYIKKFGFVGQFKILNNTYHLHIKSKQLIYYWCHFILNIYLFFNKVYIGNFFLKFLSYHNNLFIDVILFLFLKKIFK